MTWGQAVPLGARIATALGLAALLALGVRSGTDRGHPVEVSGATTPEMLAAELVSGATGPVVYVDSLPPTGVVAALLSAGSSAGRAVSLVTPGTRPRLSVHPPRAPVAQRRSALTITVRGEPDEELPLEISGDEGQNDTLTVAVGPSGVSTVQVAVEPGRPGLHRWTVRTPSTEDAAHATAWVRPQSRLRVLVLTGPPSWEARYLVRALESSGVDVVVRQELGGDLAVTSEGTGAPQALSDLESFDVVVAVGAQPPSRSALLDRWMAQRGGGLLTINPGDEEALTFATSELAWSGPAELIPLPDADIDVRGVPVTAGADGVGWPVASREGTPNSLVMATTVGRGRALLSRLETWPWVLRGGVPDAHAAYWTSVVEWLAGGLTDEVLLRGPRAQPLTAWVGGLEGAVPSTVSVGQDSDVVELATAVEVATAAPGATTDAGDEAGGGSGVRVGSVRFVPVRVGAHPVFVDDGAPFGAVVVHPGDDRLGWVEAALEVGGRGATILAAGARVTPVGLPVGGSDRRARAVFLLLAGLMAAGWSARRLRGLP